MIEGFARDARGAALRALRAGVDMDMAGNSCPHLTGLVKDGTLTLADIDGAARPILAITVRPGLFEKPCTDENLLAQVVVSPGHRQEARRGLAVRRHPARNQEGRADAGADQTRVRT